MSTGRYPRLAVGFVVVILMLAVSALPSHAWNGGGGGGGGWHGGGGGGGSSWHGGGRGFHHGFQHHHGFRGHPFGSRAFFGVGIGVPLLYPYAYPYGYPYTYPYAYPYPAYSAPAVVESSPPAYVQQNAEPAAAYWYYCSASQAYYPYVKECPDAWIQVAPQSSPPSR